MVSAVFVRSKVRASPLLRCTAGDPPSQSLLKIKALYRYELHGQRISFTLLNLTEIELGIYFVFEILKGYSTFFWKQALFTS